MGLLMSFKCIRILFLICNLIFLILGIVILAVGVYLQVSEASNYTSILDSVKYGTATSLLVASGVIVAMVAMLGCCGVWMESQCLMIVYLLFVVIIFAIEISAGVVGLMYKNELQNKFVEKLKSGMEDTQDKWDYIHKKHQCCGVVNYTDWYSVKLDITTKVGIPDSCCLQSCVSTQTAYQQGCYKKLEHWILGNIEILGALGVAIGFLQLLLLVSAIAFLCCIRQKTYD